MTDTNMAALAATPANGTASAASKPAVQRSSPYPSFTIQQSLDLTKAIYDNYGNNVHVTREQAAVLVNQSASTVQSKMSTAVQYGLLILKPKVGYKVSDLFIKWQRPLNDEQLRETLLTTFRNPPLYKALIAQFDGSMLPLAGPLANLLRQNHRIFDAACDEAAEIFIANANYLGILEADKHLRLNGAARATPAATIPEDETQSDTGDVIDPPAVIVPTGSSGGNGSSGKGADSLRQQFDIPEPEGVPITVALAGKRKATIYLPSDATAKDCETVVKWVTLLKETMD